MTTCKNPERIFVLFLCLVLVGCVARREAVKDKSLPLRESKREVLVWTSQESPPSWIYEEPEDDEEYHYFVGLSGKNDEERDARYDALRDGVVKTANFIGVDVWVIYESLKTSYNLSSEITDYNIAPEEQEKQMAEAYFSKFKAQNWYIERYEVQLVDGRSIRTYWKAYVKANIPKKEVAEAEARLKKDSFLSTKRRLLKRDLRMIILVSEKMLGEENPESIVGNELSARLIESGYRVIGAQDIGKTNVERLKMALQKDMVFSLKDEYLALTDLVVSGNCSTRAGPETYDMVSVITDAYIRVVSLKTGEIIAQKNLIGIVGFGLNQEQAGVNSLKKTGEIMAKEIMGQMK